MDAALFLIFRSLRRTGSVKGHHYLVSQSERSRHVLGIHGGGGTHRENLEYLFFFLLCSDFNKYKLPTHTIPILGHMVKLKQQLRPRPRVYHTQFDLKNQLGLNNSASFISYLALKRPEHESQRDFGCFFVNFLPFCVLSSLDEEGEKLCGRWI